MRAFAAIPPTVWNGDVKKLRGDAEAVAVYFHLLTSQHSSMIGIYPLAIGYMAHDLGIPFEGASKGLTRVCDSGLATYDDDREIVWVHDMALSQVANRLAAKDNRVTAVAKQLHLLPICPVTLAFYAKYRELFHLTDIPMLVDFQRGFEGPSEGLRSKEKEKEQDEDLETGKGTPGLGAENPQEQRPKSMFEPYPIPASIAEARSFLLSKGIPQRRLDECACLMMGGNFSDFELEGVLDQERKAA